MTNDGTGNRQSDRMGEQSGVRRDWTPEDEYDMGPGRPPLMPVRPTERVVAACGSCPWSVDRGSQAPHQNRFMCGHPDGQARIVFPAIDHPPPEWCPIRRAGETLVVR